MTDNLVTSVAEELIEALDALKLSSVIPNYGPVEARSLTIFPLTERHDMISAIMEVCDVIGYLTPPVLANAPHTADEYRMAWDMVVIALRRSYDFRYVTTRLAEMDPGVKPEESLITLACWSWVGKNASRGRTIVNRSTIQAVSADLLKSAELPFSVSNMVDQEVSPKEGRDHER